MDLTRKQRTTKYIVFCAFLLLAHLLQNTAGILPEPLGARCFIIIPALMIMIIGEEELNAALLGMFAGLLWDLTSSVHLGFNAVFFTVMCFLTAALINRLIRDTFITNMIICSCAAVLYCLFYWLFFIIIKGVPSAENTIFTFYLPCAVYTILISPAVYLIIKPIKKRITNQNT